MNENRIEFLRSDFVQGFPVYGGSAGDHISEGRFETRLPVRSEHRQQDGFVHAGVIATNGGSYRRICRGAVISPGKSILATESNLYSRRLTSSENFG